MSTYGKFNEEVCIGCMATAVMQSLTNKPLVEASQCIEESMRLTTDNGYWNGAYSALARINPRLFEFDYQEIRCFERSIEFMRYGDWDDLCDFFDAASVKPEIKKILGSKKDHIWGNNDYKEFIPILKAIATKLESLNY